MKTEVSNGRTNQSLFAMLGLLSLGPKTGYELRKLSEESIQHFWRESYGQIYPSLKELERRGWASRRVEAGQGRPDRQIYALTLEGEQTLRDWVASPAKPDLPRSELLLKIFFGGRAPTDVSSQHIAEHRQRFVEELERYQAVEQQIRKEHRQHPDLPYWLLTLGYGKRCTEAQIAWCDEAMADLRAIGMQEHEPATAV